MTVKRQLLVLSLSLAFACAPSPPPSQGSDSGAKKCGAALSDCGSGCVDTTTDRANCGGCASPCTDAEACESGVCMPRCGSLDWCAPECTDTNSDPAHCGTCATHCRTGERCSAGQCAATCGARLADCQGRCADLENDAAHCGDCSHPCASDESCVVGKCVLVCVSGLVECAGRCVDPTSDAANCGGCGKGCTGGQVCAFGHCGPRCLPGETECSGLCVKTQTDAANCGGCGKPCGVGGACSLGRCSAAPRCGSGQMPCAGKCVNTASDSLDCGTCGNACSGGQTCVRGACSGATTGIGPQGGSVDRLLFAVSGDTRPARCEDTAGYPTAVINKIADKMRERGAQFALDLGDHMYVCNGDLGTAQAQMNLFQQARQRFGGTWFMTEGNHECFHGPCLEGSTNANYVAFMDALGPISSTPYYAFNVQTAQGLASFVVIADNSWDAHQASWLESTLAQADRAAKWTIVARHHPEGDTSVATNPEIMTIVRRHKFALLLTGHAHKYEHQRTDGGRDLVLGTGGAPLIAAGTFYGFALVEGLAGGQLQVTVYDSTTDRQMDLWTVGPN